MAEGHVQAAFRDPFPARGDDLHDGGVLCAPSAGDPRGDPLVIVDNRQRGATRGEAERRVEAAEFGEDVADPGQGPGDGVGRLERLDARPTEDLVDRGADLAQDGERAVRRLSDEDDTDAARVIAVDERVEAGPERDALSAQDCLGLRPGRDRLVTGARDAVNGRLARLPRLVDAAPILGRGDDVELHRAPPARRGPEALRPGRSSYTTRVAGSPGGGRRDATRRPPSTRGPRG